MLGEFMFKLCHLLIFQVTGLNFLFEGQSAQTLKYQQIAASQEWRGLESVSTKETSA